MKIYGCISVKPVGWESFASLCSTAWWWERSPNYNNSNNFCNVNSNGNAKTEAAKTDEPRITITALSPSDTVPAIIAQPDGRWNFQMHLRLMATFIH